MKRDERIRQHQPTLKNPAEASALLDQLKEVAGKYNVLVENPQIGPGETTPYHQTVFASIETKSPWPPLVIRGGLPRSEEHTSELQSLTNLVCRLLLEKKKNTA